ncbi:alpha/beta fold hydrolase [Bacillus sp. B1-b2]|uniref:alpha/beta fold hydrolase n=1 Tax=Bacillus sp. B1-b2 TaxID=2653201 RepID=UPI001262764D|nr:alpha/beta hydrolase [Bacillus sp. B1-b2]KAB7672658.1 alpha/beta hydrolase [Bacillus sp. B1-b2]
MAKLTVETQSQPVELYYEDVGSGKPIILIHGWPLSGRTWEYQVPALVDAGYRVITYDRRGFGQSSQPYEGYDYDTLTNDLHQLIEHLDLQNITLVGFSMGGGEAVRYVSTYGTDRVEKLVLASAVPPYLYKSAEHPEGALDDATITEFLNGVKSDRIAFLDDFTTKFFRAGMQSDLVSEPFRLYIRDIASMASPKGTLDCIVSFAKTDFREDLGKITIPTLVVHGDADEVVPLESSGKLSNEMVRTSELVVIENAPHGLNATHASRFNKELLRFLSE